MDKWLAIPVVTALVLMSAACGTTATGVSSATVTVPTIPTIVVSPTNKSPSPATTSIIATPLVAISGTPSAPPTEADSCQSDLATNLNSQLLTYAAASGDNSEIYVIHGDGSEKIQLTSNAFNDLAPAWSPDEQWIAYVSERVLGVYQLVVIRADGTNEVLLLPIGVQVGQWAEASVTDPQRQLLTPGNFTALKWFDWSPDSHKIAVFGVQSDTDYIFVVDLEGSPPKILATGDTYLGTSLTWSPDSQRVAYAAALDYSAQVQRIHIANLDGSDTTTIASESYLDRDPRWHPFQQLLAFISILQPGLSPEQLNLVALDRDNLFVPLNSDDYKTQLEWSASGNTIAYGQTLIEVAGGPPKIISRKIQLLNWQGGIPKTLVEGDDVDVSDFTWSPDDCYMAFLTIRAGGYDLNVIDIYSHAVLLLAENVNHYSPSWKLIPCCG